MNQPNNLWKTVDELAIILGKTEEEIAQMADCGELESKREDILGVSVLMVKNCTYSNQRVKGITSAQWEAIRCHLRNLKEELGGYKVLGEKSGCNWNSLASFILGRYKGLSASTMEALEKENLLPDLSEVIEPDPLATPAQREQRPIASPLEDFEGATLTTTEAALDKGYTAGTIRNWCKRGKLNYIKRGRRYYVCVDEKYEAIQDKEIARIRKENLELKDTVACLNDEVARLRRQIETMQLEFAFPDPEAAPALTA